MADIQSRLQSLSEDFTKQQQELQEAVAARQKLDAQKQENLGVQKEVKKLKDDEVIYKLIGPVLLKQEKTEAESTVNGRLEFIGNEITRQEQRIQEIQQKMDKIKSDIIQIQASAQGSSAGTEGAMPAAKA